MKIRSLMARYLIISFMCSLLLMFIFKSGLPNEVTINNEEHTKLKYFDELSKKPGVVTPYNYDIILNPGLNICSEDYGRQVKILAMIPTSPENFDRRFIIRNTWGSRNVYPKQLKILFLLGKSKNKTINSNLK